VKNLQKPKLIGICIAALFLSAFFGGVAWHSLDAMMMGYRFHNEWWTSVDYWAFSPQIFVNWWIAYVITVLVLLTSVTIFVSSIFLLHQAMRTIKLENVTVTLLEKGSQKD